MAKEYTLIVNTEDCVGCRACEVACKQQHNLSTGSGWIEVHSDVPCEIEGKRQLRYAVTFCIHCDCRPCKDVCPVGAISKRQDGVVLIDEQLCNGCKDCIGACPLGVMQFQGQFTTGWNMIMALITISIVPVLLFYVFLQRYIVAGLTAGAVKG